jgi:hypothetical protein
MHARRRERPRSARVRSSRGVGCTRRRFAGIWPQAAWLLRTCGCFRRAVSGPRGDCACLAALSRLAAFQGWRPIPRCGLPFIKAAYKGTRRFCALPISAHLVRGLKWAVVCSDGTWMAPSDVHVQATGAWKESEMARYPGARANRLRRSASNGGGVRCPPSVAQGRRDAPQGAAGKPKNGTGRKTPSTRVPRGNPLGRGTAPISVAERHPRSRRTLAGIARRGRWRWQLVRGQRTNATCPQMAASCGPPPPGGQLQPSTRRVRAGGWLDGADLAGDARHKLAAGGRWRPGGCPLRARQMQRPRCPTVCPLAIGMFARPQLRACGQQL